MHTAANFALRSPRMLKHICAYQSGAAKTTPRSPLRCDTIRLCSSFTDAPGPDDTSSVRSWLSVNGVDALASLCVPHLFAYALSCGDTNVLEWLVEQGHVTWTKELVQLNAHDCNACHGARQDLGSAMTMRARSCVASAAQKGHMAMFQFLSSAGLSVAHVWPSVCAGGHLDMAQCVWMQELGTWDDANVNVAAENGHFELLRFLLDVGFSGFDQRTLALAIKYDQLEFVQCLLAYALGPASLSLPNALRYAVEHSRLELLSWLCAQPGAQDHLAATEGTALYYCASSAIVQCIQRARYQYAVKQRMSSVLLSKDLFRLVVAYQAGVDTSTIQVRALCKDLELVRNYEYDVPLPSTYATYHERFGHWLSRHDLSQLDQLCWPHLVAYALSYGNMAVLDVLKPQLFASQRRMELDCRGRRMCASAKSNLYCHKVSLNHLTVHAAESGHADLLAFLHKHDCGADNVWHRVSFFGHLNIAQLAHAHHFPGWRPHFMYNAAMAGHLDLIRFLHEHNYAGFEANTISAAVHSGNVGLVHFLLTHRPRDCTVRQAMITAADTDNVTMLRWLCDQPDAGSHLDGAVQRALVTRSHNAVAFLATDPRVSLPLVNLFERALKRKASQMT